MSKRRDARERVMQALYAWELGKDEIENVISSILKEHLFDDPEILNFATSLLLRSIDHAQELDDVIRHHTRNWDFDRIAIIDRLLLRLTITEFLFFPDIPPKVSMNEAIEVAKKYSTARSGQFINGILDSVLVDLRSQGRINKSGRGLIEEMQTSPRSAYSSGDSRPES